MSIWELSSVIPVLGASQVVLVVKNLSADVRDIRDVGLLPRLGRSSRGRHGNPLPYSCLENSMDRGAWWATVHGRTESNMTDTLSMHASLFYRWETGAWGEVA